MLAHFDFQKTLQASAYLLKKANKSMPYLKLIKLLYIADKEMLLEHGIVITCDQYYAMPHGPVLSTTYDLIKGTGLPESSTWRTYIITDNYQVKLVNDPGIEDLSEADTDMLDQVYDKYGQWTSNRIENLTHDFTEWKNRPAAVSTSVLFTPEDILRENGCEDIIPAYQEHIEIAKELDMLFS